jgi:hypothetical protein
MAAGNPLADSGDFYGVCWSCPGAMQCRERRHSLSLGIAPPARRPPSKRRAASGAGLTSGEAGGRRATAWRAWRRCSMIRCWRSTKSANVIRAKLAPSCTPWAMGGANNAPAAAAARRAVSRWRCSVLSSGERTIGTTMAEGGHRIKAGQSVRLLDVPAQRTYGAWDNLHQHPSGTAFSDALKLASVTHYGHPGRMFLERLSRDHEASFSEALDAIKSMSEFRVIGRRRAGKTRGSPLCSPGAGWRVGNRLRRDRLAGG